MQPSMMGASAQPTWALALGCLFVLVGSEVIPDPPAFSLDMVAGNLQRMADQVPTEGYATHLIQHSSGDCNCGADQEAPEEESAYVADEDFQVAPTLDASEKEAYAVQQKLQLGSQEPGPTYELGLMQKSATGHKSVGRHNAASRSGCNCASKATASSKAMSLATSSTAVSTGSGAKEEAAPTGIWLNTCHYAQPDLVFWRLTNTAYLRGGIVLKETIAYTDTCKMCEYNNVACNKEEVELTDGNCLCMWRMNGVEMKTQLLACSACVSDCIGSYKTFDLGKPEPEMQKGICLRKKPHTSFGDLEPVGRPGGSD